MQSAGTIHAVRPGATVLICGAAGLSGRSLAELCLRLGATVVLSDRSAETDLGPVLTAALDAQAPDDSPYLNRLIDARPREDAGLLDDFDFAMVLTAPGVPLSSQLFQVARGRGLPIRGENDFGCEAIFKAMEQQMLPAPLIVALTGTDGKSTTAALIAHLVNGATGLEAIACGNFGLPLSRLVLDSFPEDGPSSLPPVLVIECSSFQLELVESLHPDVAMILNLADDHLDRYPGRAEYLAAKLNIIARQNERDILLAPRSIYAEAGLPIDEVARVLPETAPSPSAQSAEEPPSVVSAELDEDSGGDALQVRIGRPRTIAVPTVAEVASAEELVYAGKTFARLADFPLSGLHNQENLRFALLALEGLEVASRHYLRGLHVNRERLAAAVASFAGLPHRMQLVTPGPALRNRMPARGRLLAINDSKATTVQAVAAALASCQQPHQRAFVLLGGRAKGTDFGQLADFHEWECFAYGEAGPQIAERLGSAPVFADLPAAYRAAADAAILWLNEASEAETETEAEAVLLLSPGCASYDAYASYQARGGHFCELVESGHTGENGT